VATGLSAVRAAVAAAAERVGRDPASITIVGVSKYASDAAVLAAYDEGLRDFGENRADDFVARAALLPSDVRWHFVGRLQGNKVRRVRPITHLLHSLDREDLARYWIKGPGRPPPALVEVNVGGEPQKGGVASPQAGRLVESAVRLGVEVRGLMTVPPPGEVAESSRPYFAALRRLRDEIAAAHPSVCELSMGMTDDYPVAVEEGATVLRVGRAIFGSFDGGD
jgi:pyridoxal phosphate enzyme (YggS family)